MQALGLGSEYVWQASQKKMQQSTHLQFYLKEAWI